MKKDADPKAHLLALEKTELELLKQINPKEKELRNLIEQLKALRILIKATGKQVQEFDNTIIEETELKKEKELFEKIESLEEVVEEMSEEKTQGSSNPNDNTSMQYASVSAQNIATAANEQTINELYSLAEKDNWTKEESDKFFDMQYAIQKTNNYKDDISDVFKENLEQSYNVLKKVQEKQSEQIKNNYNPQANQNLQTKFNISSPIENTFKPEYKKESVSKDYKF